MVKKLQFSLQKPFNRSKIFSVPGNKNGKKNDKNGKTSVKFAETIQ